MCCVLFTEIAHEFAKWIKLKGTRKRRKKEEAEKEQEKN